MATSPNDPPSRHDTSATGASSVNCAGDRGTRSARAKPMKLKPAALPRLSGTVGASRNRSRNGKRNDPTSRVRSRRNLKRSRVAMAAMGLSSFTGENPQVYLLEAGLRRRHHGEWRLEHAYDLVR